MALLKSREEDVLYSSGVLKKYEGIMSILTSSPDL